MKRLLVLLAACGQGGGARVSGDLDQATLENVQLAFVADGKAKIDMTILAGKDRKPLGRFVNDNIGPSVELELVSEAKELLCKGSYSIGTKELDPKTGHVSSVTQLQGVDKLSCVDDLLTKDFQGKPSLRLRLAENGKVLQHSAQLASFTVPDNRPAKIPELDTAIATLRTQIAAVDPVLVVPPCTPALAGTAQLDGVDQLHFLDKPPAGSDAAWDWLRSPLFYAIEQYEKREYPEPAELLARMKAATKVLVFVADKHVMPKQIDAKNFTPGVFEGFIYVLDRAGGKQVCVLPLQITNSEVIDYTAKITKDTRTDETVSTESDAQIRLRMDFQKNFEAGVVAALDKAGIGGVKPRFSGFDKDR